MRLWQDKTDMKREKNQWGDDLFRISYCTIDIKKAKQIPPAK